MEALLSVAFDNLSSFDGPKIRKGLRQVEGLLAQICLAKTSSPAAAGGGSPTKPSHRRRGSKLSVASSAGSHRDDDGGSDDVGGGSGSGSGDGDSGRPRAKSLGELGDDLAFLEFFKLQEGFEWNVAMRLVNTLDRLIAKGGDGQNDLLILSALDLMQGLLLLHPPSKALFSREQNMNLLLDLLEPSNCPAIQSATLLALVAALVDFPQNTRAFESLDGLLTITSLFRSRSTARDVKLKLVEFLYFYLMPETPSIPRADARDSVPAMLQRSPSKLAGAFGGAADKTGAAAARRRANSEDGTRTTEEKQALLGRHLSSVEDLVRDLNTSTPFGGVVC